MVEKVVFGASINREGAMNKKSNTDLIEEIKEFASKQNVQSLDELNEKVATFIKSKNEMPVAHFLGITPHQMQQILYRTFELSNILFRFSCNDVDHIKQIAVIKQAKFLLEKLQQVGELKGTQLGNLPKSLVVEFYQLFTFNERFAMKPNREDDVFELSRLKHLLSMSGIIKVKNNKFYLTKKGELILSQENDLELLREIIFTWANTFHWGFGDGYPDLILIQKSSVFNFYLLHKFANSWIEDKKLGRHFLEAFPDLVHEVRNSYAKPEDEIISCFCVRFLERFCLPLGLVEKKEEGKIFVDLKTYYKVTPFFLESFNFS
jgi:hypothetical protein